MESLILSLHVVVCVVLIVLVLLQSGKEGMGVIFGGGNASVFGSSGAGGPAGAPGRGGGKGLSIKRKNPSRRLRFKRRRWERKDNMEKEGDHLV